MQIGKWGNSLAVRLPASVVESLQLSEGDHITIEIASNRTLRVAKEMTVEEALARMDAIARPLPAGFRFSRDEANERGRGESANDIEPA